MTLATGTFALEPGSAGSSNQDEAGSGAIRLQQPSTTVDPATNGGSNTGANGGPNTTTGTATSANAPRDQNATTQPYNPSAFEVFVRQQADRSTGLDGLRADTTKLKRFGSELMIQPSSADDYATQIPPDYVLKAGDEVVVTLWGSVDADLRLIVDRSGHITIPRVGPVLVAGVRYADLSASIERRVGQVFRNFQLSVALGRLRSMRIYLTGFVEHPGSYTVSSLSTLVNVIVRGGGPSSAGSFRNISVQRAGKTVTRFDFYDLLLKGDKSHDIVLEPEDVVNVGPIETQVGIIGSVNRQAIFELKDHETIADLLTMAGGFDAVADRTRLSIERLENRASTHITQLTLPAAMNVAPSTGDVVMVFSAVQASQPLARQNKHVIVDGEVAHPGDIVLPAGSRLSDAIAAAGGMTSEAFLFGAEFSRESVRRTQQENFDHAIRDMEIEIARSAASTHGSNSDDASAGAARFQASNRLLDRLRTVHPTGRMVLLQSPEATTLPDIQLEDQDHLYIPPRPTTVGVFGSVYNTGSYLYVAGHDVQSYLNLAGGATDGGELKRTYVLRANGTVVNDSTISHSWFSSGGRIRSHEVEPGDTIFVPEDWDKTSFTDGLRAWTQILYQSALGVAALKVIGQ